MMSVARITAVAQYLTLKLSGEVFAVEVAKVREILEYTVVMPIPKTPDYMRGVINVRGSVVPVIDLRLKFGMEPAGPTVNTCIIVLEIELEGQAVVLGALADSVQEVIEIDPADIEAPPKTGGSGREFMKGIGKRDGGFVMILDMETVFSELELQGPGGSEEAEDLEGAA
jgi:purine-binding chemotaxis protein CheW